MYFGPSLRRLTPTGGSLRERMRTYFFPVIAFGLYHRMIFLRVMGGMSSAARGRKRSGILKFKGLSEVVAADDFVFKAEIGVHVLGLRRDSLFPVHAAVI